MATDQKQIIKYFSFTFLVTWLLWAGSVAANFEFSVPVILLIIGMFANFTPSAMALWLKKREIGSKALGDDLKSRFTFKGTLRWWLFILIVFPLISLIALVGAKWFGSEIETPLLNSPWMIPVVILQIAIVGGALGEEFGWRYYALDKLQKMYHPLVATLVLGILWSLWHLPLFYMAGTVQSNLPIWQFLLQNTLIAFFYTWMYNKTKGNMALMIGLHTIANASSAVFPYWQTNVGRWIGFALLTIVLIICVFTKKEKNVWTRQV